MGTTQQLAQCSTTELGQMILDFTRA